MEDIVPSSPPSYPLPIPLSTDSSLSISFGYGNTLMCYETNGTYSKQIVQFTWEQYAGPIKSVSKNENINYILKL